MLKEIWHSAFTVRDLERSLQFYCGILGLELVHRQQQSNAYTSRLTGYDDADLLVAMLKLPDAPSGLSGHALELIEYVHPAGEPVDAATCNPGSAHLAFAIENMAETHRRLLDRGVKFKSDPVLIEAGRNKGGYTVYFLDPDGITLELIQPPPGRDGARESGAQ